MNQLYHYIIFIHFASITQAQTVRGMIGDQNHEPLIGATILELGTSNGTISDVNGRFSLTLKSSDNLLAISYAGYKSDTIQADISN